jgi:PhnB protein
MDHMTDTSSPKPATAGVRAGAGPAPAGSQRLVTFFAVPDCAKAMDFYRDALGAEEVSRAETEDGTIMHAEMRLGDCLFQLSEPFPSYGLVGPPAEANSFTITYWTDDVDAVFNLLVAAGAAVMSPLADVFSGDRMGVVRCPFGIRWCIARHDRDVSAEEIEAAARALATTQEN